MGLHQTGIVDSIIGRTHTNVPRRFLHDDAQDGANVDAGLPSDSFDGLLDVGNFALAVVEFHQLGVAFPEEVVLLPATPIREVGRAPAVVFVPSAALSASLGAGNTF